MHALCLQFVFFALHQITTTVFELHIAERNGWWLFEEGLIMPRKRDKIGRYEIVQVTYTGNSNCHEDEPWRNWSCLLNPIGTETIVDGTEDSPVGTRQKRRGNNTSDTTNTSGTVLYILHACLVCMSCTCACVSC